MATRTVTSTSTREVADGFLNIRVTAKDGSIHSFKTGIALHKGRKLDSVLLKNPELFIQAMKEGRVTASVWVPTDSENQETLDL